MNEASDPTTSNNLENKYVSFLKENFPELADKTREEVLSVLGDDNGELIQSEPPSSAKAEQYEEILNEAPFDIQDEVNFQSATSVQKFTQNAVTAIETINKMLRVEGKPELDSTLINKRFVEGFLYKGFFRILNAAVAFFDGSPFFCDLHTIFLMPLTSRNNFVIPIPCL